MTDELQAVLWDMDGTLVDTEPYWYQAEVELLEEYGQGWSVQESEALIGNALPLTATVLQQAGVDLSVREIIDRLSQSVAQQVQHNVPWKPGARDLLRELRANSVPCALVTMSEPTLTREVLRHLPHGTFTVQVTGSSVARGKPEPDAYLLAASRLAAQHAEPAKLSTAGMVAIEDSLTGVTSALAAGLATVGIPNILPLSPQPGLTLWSTLAGKTIDDLTNLLGTNAHTESTALICNSL